MGHQPQATYLIWHAAVTRTNVAKPIGGRDATTAKRFRFFLWNAVFKTSDGRHHHDTLDFITLGCCVCACAGAKSHGGNKRPAQCTQGTGCRIVCSSLPPDACQHPHLHGEAGNTTRQIPDAQFHTGTLGRVTLIKVCGLQSREQRLRAKLSTRSAV